MTHFKNPWMQGACTLLLSLAAASADLLKVDFPASHRFPVFPQGSKVEMELQVQRDNSTLPGTAQWIIEDYLGNPVRRGEVTLPAGEEHSKHLITLEGLPAGYLEVKASLKGSDAKLPRRGSRPEGMATFGITSPLKALPLAAPDESRFGIQGTNFIQTGVFLKGNPYNPLYTTLGVHWVNVGNSWSDGEPEEPGTFAASLTKKTPAESDYIPNEFLSPLVCVFNMPWWAIDYPEGVKENRKDGASRQAYPPKDYTLYGNYLELLARDHATTWKKTYPKLKEVHYQIGWEPDWHWKGTDEQFVKLYKTAYDAIHRGDPKAVVMGPGYGVMKTGVEHLERLLPMGLDKALDGIAIHGYYVPFGDPRATTFEGKYVSPEEGKTVETMRRLRRLMAQYLPPGAKLFQTEWGLDYRGKYYDLTPETLRRQAAYVIRGHLIFLGEGCDMTYFFYTADYGNLEKQGEDGYGLCFNLTMPKPSFGATYVSPKPVFMAAAALTRVLEGTKTIGALELGEGLSAYAFQRGDEIVLALWSKDNLSRKVKIPTESASMKVIDFMGNPSEIKSADGSIEIEASTYPIYLMGVSQNLFEKKAQ